MADVRVTIGEMPPLPPGTIVKRDTPEALYPNWQIWGCRDGQWTRHQLVNRLRERRFHYEFALSWIQRWLVAGDHEVQLRDPDGTVLERWQLDETGRLRLIEQGDWKGEHPLGGEPFPDLGVLDPQRDPHRRIYMREAGP